MSGNINSAVRISDIRVIEPKELKLREDCFALLNLEPCRWGNQGRYTLRFTLRSRDDSLFFTEVFMGRVDFDSLGSADIDGKMKTYLEDLVGRRRAYVSVHSLDPKQITTCVSIMFRGNYCEHYMAMKGDPRGLDKTKNPRISTLLQFFEKVE